MRILPSGAVMKMLVSSVLRERMFIIVAISVLFFLTNCSNDACGNEFSQISSTYVFRSATFCCAVSFLCSLAACTVIEEIITVSIVKLTKIIIRNADIYLVNMLLFALYLSMTACPFTF